MEFLIRVLVKLREWHRGQALTGYAMILAAVAVALEVFVTYEVLGHNIKSSLR